MIEKQSNERDQLELAISVGQLVPKNHLLRKIEAAIDFKKVYRITEKYYCKDNGRPAVDPVVLVKMLFIQHLFGIPSLRRTVAEIEMNIAYRWFLGFGFTTRVPHFATLSYAFATRFPQSVVEEIFAWILDEAVQRGFVDSSMVFVDSTPVKANANRNKKAKVWVEKTSRSYEKQLRDEINLDRESHGKKPLKEKNNDYSGSDNPNVEIKQITQSKTDPESGILRKGDHKVDFAYSIHTACDKNNFILSHEITAANVHDSRVFEDVYNKTNKVFDPEIYVADAAYKTPWLCKKVFDDGKKFSLPYKRPMTKRGFFKSYEYVYDEYYDCVICPENQVLPYKRTDKDGYRIFQSDSKICKNCPQITQCTHSANHKKSVIKHIWSNYIELAEDFRHSPQGKESYQKRHQTIERVFADAKEKHHMRYTHFRGLKRVGKSITLILAAMNLKKLATWAWSNLDDLLFCLLFSLFTTNNPISLYRNKVV